MLLDGAPRSVPGQTRLCTSSRVHREGPPPCPYCAGLFRVPAPSAPIELHRPCRARAAWARRGARARGRAGGPSLPRPCTRSGPRLGAVSRRVSRGGGAVDSPGPRRAPAQAPPRPAPGAPVPWRGGGRTGAGTGAAPRLLPRRAGPGPRQAPPAPSAVRRPAAAGA